MPSSVKRKPGKHASRSQELRKNGIRKLTLPSKPQLLARPDHGGLYTAPARADGLDTAQSYILRRSLDGENFTDVGDPFTGAATNVFVDSAPPEGKALYQIWTAP